MMAAEGSAKEVEAPLKGISKTLDFGWRNVTDPALCNVISEVKEVLDNGHDQRYFLDLSGNRLSLVGLEAVIDFLMSNAVVDADVSINCFGFADAYRALEKKGAVSLLTDGRIAFDPNGDKTVEALAARLMDTKGNLNDLQDQVIGIKTAKEASQKEWKGWKQVESDALEVKVSMAVAKRLEEGEVILTNYKWKGVSGDLDGLVIGKLDGEPIYVLVEAKHNVDKNRGTANKQLKSSSAYFDETLLCPEQDAEGGEDDLEKWQLDRQAIQVAKIQGRRRFWAFGGVEFKHPHLCHMEGKDCFMVQPNHDNQFEVFSVKKQES